MSKSSKRKFYEKRDDIRRLQYDLTAYKNMADHVYLQKALALRTLCARENRLQDALFANLLLRKRLNRMLGKRDLDIQKRKFLFKSYWQTYLFAAPYDFHSYLLYLEKDREAEKRFYQPRLRVLRPIVKDLQDLADGKLKRYALSMPPGTGKSTLEIFFITWIMGRDPMKPSLATAYADKLTRSFFDGALQVVKDPEYNFNDVFPTSTLAATNSKDETIDLAKQKRFKTLTCRSIDSGLTVATRCETLAYADDLVSGSEEALNIDRMDILWTKFCNDFLSRMKQDCRLLVIGTRWGCRK